MKKSLLLSNALVVFKDGASVADTRLLREGIGKVVLNLDKALANPNGKNDIILQAKDMIDIPYNNDIVMVGGQVLDPISMKYEADSANIKFYINAAGGFAENPWKDRISVKYANGENKTTKRIFFIRKYPKVKPGSIVTVPRKPEKKEGQKFDTKELSTITGSVVTSLSTLVTLYFLITNKPG